MVYWVEEKVYRAHRTPHPLKASMILNSERQGFVASRFKILAAVLHVHLSVCRTVLRPRTVLSVQCVV